MFTPIFRRGNNMSTNAKRSKDYQEKFTNYLNEHKVFFNNPLIKDFLNDEKNKALLQQTICQPSKENNRLLDHAFKQFYFHIRFTSYISSALYFNAINFDKRHRKMSSRSILTVDQSIGDADNETFKALICDEKAEIDLDHMMKSDLIFDYIEDPLLYAALKILTDKQIEIINLAYINGLSDTEIGIALNKTQQSVSKTHKKAIKNIACFMKERRLKHDNDRNPTARSHFS